MKIEYATEMGTPTSVIAPTPNSEARRGALTHGTKLRTSSPMACHLVELQALSQENVRSSIWAGHALAHDGTKTPTLVGVFDVCWHQGERCGTEWSMWYFYILRGGKDRNWFYEGATGDLRKRFAQHANGEVGSARPFRPLMLVYSVAKTHQRKLA